MSPQWLLRDGRPFARSFVLSHKAQLDQLRELTPAALPAAMVAGDPCYDRIVVSLPFRARYRRALDIGNRTLVFVSSTWSSNSTLGTRFDLFRELLAELPRDSYVLATALHPNISHRHGPGQIRHWFADCLRAGLLILPEIDGWRAGIIAADIVIGDNGSVTGYCSGIGIPTLLASFPDVPDGTAIAAMGRTARRLPTHGPFLPHIETAIAEHDSGRYKSVDELITSEPGRSLPLLRELFYTIMDVPAPASEVSVPIVPIPPGPVPPGYFADEVVAEFVGDVIALSRFPAELVGYTGPQSRFDLPNRHLCCSADYPIRALRQKARILVGSISDTDDPGPWLRSVLERHPRCVIAAIGEDGYCVALTRNEDSVTLTGGPPELSASALCAWLDAGFDLAALTRRLQVKVGANRFDIIAQLGPKKQ